MPPIREQDDANESMPSESVPNQLSSALFTAVQEGDVRRVAALLATTTVAARALLEATNSTGQTALMCAACHGHVNVVNVLLHAGANVDASGSDGRTALLFAAVTGHTAVVKALVRHRASLDVAGEDGRTALSLAAEEGEDEIVAELVQNGATLDIQDNDGRTALSYVAEEGDVDVATTLLNGGAAVDLRDNSERTPLSYAAEHGHVDVMTELIKRGADVNASDSDGKTALMYATTEDERNAMTELLQHSAVADVTDTSGRTALMLALERGSSTEVITALIPPSAASLNASDCSGRTALSFAAENGHVDVVTQLIELGAVVDVEAVSVDSEASPIVDVHSSLWYAAACGHTDVVQCLLKHNASVEPSLPSLVLGHSGTALSVAGRAGHIQIVRDLIAAGAAVNVQGEHGETPLISAARWDFVAGVQLLIAHGGSLKCKENESNCECPLIPTTLQTMQSIKTFEFHDVCLGILARVQAVCSQLQQRSSAVVTTGAAPVAATTTTTVPVDVDTLVTFTGIVYRLCRLMVEIERRPTVLLRFIASRAVIARVRDIHEELDYFVSVHVRAQQQQQDQEEAGNSDGDAPRWREQLVKDEAIVRMRFRDLLRTDKALLDGCTSEWSPVEMVTLLQHELDICSAQKNGDAQADVKDVLVRFTCAIKIDAPPLATATGTVTVPSWFIARDDVRFHAWNLVRTNSDVSYYKGKWRRTNVLIEVHHVYSDPVAFAKTASQWFALSHPHVVNLLGACHVGHPQLFVFERVPKGKPLVQVWSDETARVSKWKLLHEAALGIQYLHAKEVVHGTISSENIVVSSDQGAKLTRSSASSDTRSPHSSREQPSSRRWSAPELARGKTWLSPASDVFALGLCVSKALALELPSETATALHDYVESGGSSALPARPPGVSDVQWDLITTMCAVDPTKRLSMDAVVNQLNRIQHELETLAAAAHASKAPCLAPLNEHSFADLHGYTLPKALKYCADRVERLSGDPWMRDDVYPAFVRIFELLQAQERTATDLEVVTFRNALVRFQRYLHTPGSPQSVDNMRRSRDVAKHHGVIYDELDRLLDLLGVPEDDAIRVWKNGEGAHESFRDLRRSSVGVSAIAPGATTPKAIMSIVSLNHVDSPTARHDEWTKRGLAQSPTRPLWYISLREVIFSDAARLGKGAFGAVYKGSWRGTPVVVKFMGYDSDANTISTDLLLHEVRVWHRLNHSHVLKLYGACHVDKRYFVCEYAPNGDLAAFLERPGNKHLVWQKLYEAALALEYLHSQHIAHHDLKCDNIMIGADGKVKLIDFGLSCLVGEAEIQVDVKRIGAVNWRSPEYLAGNRPSLASDVYSFAMCILEAVSGNVPWGRLAPVGIKYQVKRGKLPALPDAMTAEQYALIKQMTKLEPSQRVKMTFVVTQLEQFAKSEPRP